MTLKAAEILGLCGLVVSLASVWLHWNMQLRLSNIEDSHKDGRITEQMAEQKMRFWKYFAPALTLAGVTMLGIAAFGLFS